MGATSRGVALRAFGAVILLAGVASAVIGPLELYSFYLFAAGGRFHYEGFGFGSFMFGFIAIQIIGYYVIAVLLIPVGYGNLALRPWARHATLALIWCWLVLGVPLLLLLIFTVFSIKELPFTAAVALLVAIASTYPLLPLLLRCFYRADRTREVFERRGIGERPSWLERVPLSVLVLAILLAFYAVVLHLPILFNGLFPVFGRWLTGLPGIAGLDLAAVFAIALAWAVLGRRRWAWWVSLAYVTVLGSSLVASLGGSSYAYLLAMADFPARELEILSGMPIQGYHLAALAGLPLLGTLGVIIAARRDLQVPSRPEKNE
jgi:hypothetical protein